MAFPMFGSARQKSVRSRNFGGSSMVATPHTSESTHMNNRLSTPLWGAAVLSLALMGGCNKTPEAGAVALPSPSNAANVADLDVTTNVKKALLSDASLKGFDISVITLKGDVRLIGVVDTQGQIDAAVKLARGSEGVHSIHDELAIKK
ncbi:MAG: BON domain-containing protein [Burkholderiaceae bacterium]